MAAGDKEITLVARVKNPSSNYGATFSYRFEIAVMPNSQMADFYGRASIPPQREKYIVVPGVDLDYRDTQGVNLLIDNLEWNRPPSGEASEDSVTLRYETNISGETVTVAGLLSNKGAGQLKNVRLTAILFNKEGEVIQASTTTLDQVRAFTDRSFTVYFPRGKTLMQEVDVRKTLVFWDAPQE